MMTCIHTSYVLNSYHGSMKDFLSSCLKNCTSEKFYLVIQKDESSGTLHTFFTVSGIHSSPGPAGTYLKTTKIAHEHTGVVNGHCLCPLYRCAALLDIRRSQNDNHDGVETDAPGLFSSAVATRRSISAVGNANPQRRIPANSG